MRFAAFVLASALCVTATAQQQVYDAGDGVTLPIVIKQVKPHYTPAAMAAKIQGSVLLKAVVRDDGTVSDVEVVKSLDRELDEQAVAAFRQWAFKPGTREGKPVAVRVHCELSFTL